MSPPTLIWPLHLPLSLSISLLFSFHCKTFPKHCGLLKVENPCAYQHHSFWRKLNRNTKNVHTHHTHTQLQKVAVFVGGLWLGCVIKSEGVIVTALLCQVSGSNHNESKNYCWHDWTTRVEFWDMVGSMCHNSCLNYVHVKLGKSANRIHTFNMYENVSKRVFLWKSDEIQLRNVLKPTHMRETHYTWNKKRKALLYFRFLTVSFLK